MIDLERLARIHVELTAGASWGDLLRRERMTRAQWTAAERAWLDALSADASAGRFELADRYLRALAGAPSVEASPVPMPIAPAAPSPPIVSMPAIPAAMLRFTDVQATQDASAAPPPAPALPFGPGTPPPPSQPRPVAQPAGPPRDAPAWMPKGLQGVTDLDGTRAMPDVAPSPALPFASADAGPPKPKQEAPAARLPKAMQGLTEIDATQMPSPEAGKAPALPFAPGSAAMPPPSAPRPETAAVRMPKGMQAFADIDGTQIGSAEPAGPALPFAPPAAPEPAPVSAPPSAPAAASPRLSLEQYARLCVELAAYPAHRAEVLRRYDIDQQQGAQTEAHWSARMNADPTLRKAWEAHCAAHQAWLHHAQRKG
jgi:hypothetical protein